MSTYDEKMTELELITFAFMQTEAYKPYLTPQGLVWLVTEDPYTNPKYGEPDARRWSIYCGPYKGPDEAVSLRHPHLKGQVYFDSPEAAQVALDAYAAKKKGWTVIPKPKKEETNGEARQLRLGGDQ